MDKHYDIIILGGGCAGLSLAMRLADAGSLSPTVLILEKRRRYTNDRTWCFWDVNNPALKDWIDYAWSHFQIKSGHRAFTRSCKNHPYLMISAKTFYQRAVAKVALNKRVTLSKNQTIIKVTKTEQQTWQINTQTSTYTADKIVDTRPSKSMDSNDSVLWQLFVGVEVKTNANAFDPKQFVLMDFDETFTQGLGFIYVLPFSVNRALIEYTVFTDKVVPIDKLKECLTSALQAYLKDVDYKIIRTERGQLPMGNEKIKKSDDPSYIFAGLFAGAARPSSGYAFQRIQSWATECATQLISHQPLIPQQKDNTVLAIMDSIFLKVLKSNFLDSKPYSAINLFFCLFKKCNTSTIIRFLSDSATPLDCFSVVVSMPKRAFLKVLPSYMLDRLVKYKND